MHCLTAVNFTKQHPETWLMFQVAIRLTHFLPTKTSQTYFFSQTGNPTDFL